MLKLGSIRDPSARFYLPWVIPWFFDSTQKQENLTLITLTQFSICSSVVKNIRLQQLVFSISISNFIQAAWNLNFIHFDLPFRRTRCGRRAHQPPSRPAGAARRAPRAGDDRWSGRRWTLENHLPNQNIIEWRWMKYDYTCFFCVLSTDKVV